MNNKEMYPWLTSPIGSSCIRIFVHFSCREISVKDYQDIWSIGISSFSVLVSSPILVACKFQGSLSLSSPLAQDGVRIWGTLQSLFLFFSLVPSLPGRCLPVSLPSLSPVSSFRGAVSWAGWPSSSMQLLQFIKRGSKLSLFWWFRGFPKTNSHNITT